MKMIFKQRLFSWFDSYDVYDDRGNVLYKVQGKFGWGHKLEIYDALGNYLGKIQEKITWWLPVFEIYEGEKLVGSIKREFTFFKPRFTMQFLDWQIDGNWLEWDYSITDKNYLPVAQIHKELFQWTDTYTIETKEQHALHVLMVVLTIDAEKCSRGD